MEITERIFKRAEFQCESINKGENYIIEVIMLFDYTTNLFVVQVNNIDIEYKHNTLMREETFECDDINKADMYYCFECSKMIHKWYAETI